MSIILYPPPSTAVSSKLQTVVATACPYSSNAGDQNILLSGTSGTLTLNTAVGNKGQVIAIQHEGTSLSQVYTLNTTSAQTIGGIASGSYALYTNGEVLRIVSDGSNWQILDHYARTGITTGTPTITGSTSNPTKGSMTTDLMTWYRDGRYAVVSYRYVATTAGSAGSGVYLIQLINSLTIDTTYQNTDSGTSTLSIGLANCEESVVFGQTNTASVVVGTAQANDTTHIKVGGLIGGTINYWSSAGGPLSGTNVQMYFYCKIPIVGWQP